MLRLSVSALLFAPSLLLAQTQLHGFVRDSAGKPVGGATVTIAALGRAAESDSAGAFELTRLTPGLRSLSVRRIGFSAFSQVIRIAAGDNALAPIVLSRVVTTLDTVVTQENTLWREAPLLREFEENRKIGLGKFFTRADLEKARGQSMMSFFENLPGFMSITLQGGRWIKSIRRTSANPHCYELEDQFGPMPPGMNCGCFPLVFLDFQKLSTPQQVPNINRYRPDDLEAMEVYRNPAQTPQRYSLLNSECGVIVLHSRRPPAGKSGR